jgi:alkanesulfonate monooxygenase
VLSSLDPGPNGDKVDDLLRELERLAKLGVDYVHGSVPNVSDPRTLAVLGERVVPAAAQISP